MAEGEIPLVRLEWWVGIERKNETNGSKSRIVNGMYTFVKKSLIASMWSDYQAERYEQ